MIAEDQVISVWARKRAIATISLGLSLNGEFFMLLGDAAQLPDSPSYFMGLIRG